MCWGAEDTFKNIGAVGVPDVGFRDMSDFFFAVFYSRKRSHDKSKKKMGQNLSNYDDDRKLNVSETCLFTFQSSDNITPSC